MANLTLTIGDELLKQAPPGAQGEHVGQRHRARAPRVLRRRRADGIGPGPPGRTLANHVRRQRSGRTFVAARRPPWPIAPSSTPTSSSTPSTTTSRSSNSRHGRFLRPSTARCWSSAPRCWPSSTSPSRKSWPDPSTPTRPAGPWPSLAQLPVVSVDADVVLAAIDLATRHQLSFWDAQIVQAAVTAGCSSVLTEDLSDGAVLGGIRVENPFAAL